MQLCVSAGISQAKGQRKREEVRVFFFSPCFQKNCQKKKMGEGNMWSAIQSVLKQIDDFVWGVPLMVLILSGGLLLTVRLGLLQVRKLGLALKWMVQNEEEGEGEISSFAALCTALSATIGTGNIVGVATAVCAGGPGALFWMIMAAFLGMATKYSEGLLAVKYRVVDESGHSLGGPFYYIEKGMGKNWKWLAKIFAFFGACVGLFGIGTFSQVVVPFMAIIYFIFALALVLCNIKEVPQAIVTIVQAAFNPKAVTGGVVGSMLVAMQNGVARGIFSNEAGLGSAPIAAAAAQTKEPVRQGLVSMTGTFIDTIVICTLTGLSVVITGAWQVEGLEGVQVTTYAFQNGLPFSNQFCAAVLMICLVFFAFTTILGWDYYGERCLEYLTGKDEKKIKIYRWLYILAVFIGPYMTVAAVWTIADIFNGLMALPNMIALFALSGVVVKETKRFFEVYADQKMAKKKSSASIKDAAEN